MAVAGAEGLSFTINRLPPAVVTVARRGELTQEIASDFGISVESVRRWVRQADVDDGISDGVTTAEQNDSAWDPRVLLTLETRMEHGNQRWWAAEAAEVPRRAA